LRLKFYLVLLQIDPRERQNRRDQLIDIDEGLLLHIVFEHRTKVRDDVARPDKVRASHPGSIRTIENQQELLRHVRHNKGRLGAGLFAFLSLLSGY
jgi:hypothetical protein